MAYIPKECTKEQYNNAVYSQDAKHKLYLKIGNTVVEEPDNFCESMTLKNLLLDDGSKNFHLDNFVSKTIELILHDYTIEDLTQEIDIKLGTYINPTIGYVYVPIGVYKVQDNPTTNKNKTTYKLRDRSVNFDFGYNAQEIIEKSSKTDEKGNKYVTKLEIVDDICSKAGVTYVGDRNFAGYDDKIGIYDNSVTGRIYISYIFEQAGRIATINREGNLTSVLINNNLNVQELPFDLIESYTIKQSYKISKTIYESGAIYFENGTETDDMLFINGSNPYIANQNELDRVARLINGFEIDSYSISKIIGNPAIDSYDLIQLNTGNNIYKTLAQNTLKYNGKLTQSFETNIEYEARQTNSTKNGEMTFRKYVKSEIDNINATIKTTVEETTAQIKGLEESIDLFSVDLSQYTLTIPTNSNRYPLETKTYTVNYYGYYKGKQVKPSVSVSGNKVGITTSTTTENVGFAVDTNTPINGLSNNFTLTFTYNSPDGVYTLTKVITIGLSIQGKDGINGVDGKDGTSVNILGSYNSLQELQQAHPTGNVGDAYLINGDMYVWSSETKAWTNVGNIQGAEGKSAYEVWLDAGNTGTEQDYLNSLKGATGDAGYTPIKGIDYFDGQNGKDGYTPQKGVDYFDGTNGTDGRGIKTTDISYQIGTSGNTPPTGTWLSNIPTAGAGQFVWTRTIITYTDNTSTTSYSVSKYGTNGEDGYTPVKGVDYYDGKDGTSVSITSTSVTYQASSSGTVTPTGTWQTTVPSISNGQYLWTRTIVNYSDGKSTTSYSVSYKGTNGKDGYTPQKGIDYFDGKDGENGTSERLFIKYSANSNGNPMTSTPQSDTAYMGTAITTATTPPTSYTAYTWVKTQGIQGIAGKTGDNGLTPYVHIMYSADGSTFVPEEVDDNGNVVYPLGKKPSAWMGQYVDYNKTESTNFDDYEWYKFTEDIDGTLNDMQNDINQNKTDINNNYQDLVNQIDKKANDEELVIVKNSVETITTKLNAQIAVTEEIIANGVSKVTTTSGTFDINGLLIEKNGAETSTRVNQIGVNVKDTGNNDALFAGYIDDNKAEENEKLKDYKGQTVVYSNNMIVENYLVIGTHSRIEDYEDGSGIFVTN